MRIWYKAKGFGTGKEVTMWFIKPDLVQTATMPFTEWGEGFYYLDYNIRNNGPYIGKAFENNIPTVAAVFRYGVCPGIVTKV